MSSTPSTASRTGDVVEWLCAEGPRRSGTDVERRLALGLAERLRSPRRRASIEPVYVHPQWQLVQFAHCAIAIAGSLLAGVDPAVGFALVLAAATSFYLDVSGRLYLLRRLFFRRASQNVVSTPTDAGERPRVVITAGYDAGLTGAAYNGWATAGFERLQRVLLPGAPSPATIIFWSMALLLPALGLRMAGIEDSWVAALQLPQTLILMVAAFMLGEIGLSPVSPGAAHNGSGVAAALAAAEALDADPPQALAVSVVLASASEAGCEGLRAFLRGADDALPRDRTWFIDLSSVGSGSPRYVAKQTPVLTQPLDGELLALCEALAGERDARRLEHAPAGGAAMAAGRGYRAIALTARQGSEFFPAGRHQPGDRPEAVDPATLEATAAFTVDLIRLLDRQLARERPDGAPQEQAAEKAPSGR